MKREKMQVGIIAAIVVLIDVFAYTKTLGVVGLSSGYVSVVSVICMVLGSVGIIIVAYVALLKKMALHLMYAVIAVLFAIIYMVVMPAYSVPDEKAHYDSAYEMSNKMLGIQEPEDEHIIYKRACDNQYFESMLLGQLYLKYEKTFEANPDLEIEEGENHSTKHYFAYIPLAVGLTIGRLCHLNFPLTTMLGVLLNLSVFVTAITYAIKKTPIGKKTIFVIGLLPLVVQLSKSYSYDVPLFAATVLIIALTLNWFYGEKRVRALDVVLFILSSLMLIYLKSGVYAFVILLPIVLMDKKKLLQGKRKKYFLALCTVIALMIIMALMSTPVRTMVAERLSRKVYIEYCGLYGRSLEEVFSQWGLLMLILQNTVRSFGISYLEQWAGNQMGWLEIPGISLVVKIILLVLLSSFVRSQDERYEPNPFARFVMICISGLMVFLSALAMLTCWTPPDYITIVGLQGRYFLPALLLAAFAIGQWRKPVMKKAYESYYAIVMPILLYITILNVLAVVIRG